MVKYSFTVYLIKLLIVLLVHIISCEERHLKETDPLFLHDLNL